MPDPLDSRAASAVPWWWVKPLAADDPTRLLASVYTTAACQYAQLWSPVIRPMGERLVEAMPLATVRAVLEVGVGTGALIRAIRAAAPGARIVGIDTSDGMLRLARRQAPPISLALMAATALALRPAVFDAAVLAFVLFHLPEPERGLAESARVLRPGGVVGVATWGADQLLPRSDIWDEELEAHGAPSDNVPPSVRQHALMDTPDKLTALLGRAGLSAERVWSARFERPWEWRELFDLRARYGLYQRRLIALTEDGRSRCLARIRERMAALAAEEMLWRPEVVFAVACRR